MALHRKKSSTKRVVRNAAMVTGTAGAAVGLAAVPTTAHAATNWDPIIACESGGNPTAQNATSTASGLFQFLDSSWLAYGGGQYASRAKNATVDQQYAVADAAFVRSGLSPWAASQSCWAGKVSVKATPPRAPMSAPSRAPRPRVVTPALPRLPRHAPQAGRHYVVQSGDSLWRIAAQTTGDGANWNNIYNMNQSTIGDNPNLITPGEDLVL